MGESTEYESLESRVVQFDVFALPGQPHGMHMRTHYLVHDLWREVQRLTAALGSKPQEWQPMDTAPWNGTQVLLWRDRDKQHYVAARVSGEHGPGWCTPDGYEIFHPSKWQPLPAPPLSASPQREGT